MNELKKQIKKIDKQVLDIVSSWPHPAWLVALMWTFTVSGYGGMLWLGLSFLLAVYLDNWGAFVSMMLVQAIGFFVVTVLLKGRVKRQRPSLSLDDKIAAVVGYKSYSFPSGHAASSVIAFLLLTFFLPAAWVWAGPLALVVVFSRLYLNKHYFSDIVAGAGIGLALGLASVWILSMYL